jgi:phosphate transport system protein
MSIEHIVRAYDYDLDTLNKKILKMGMLSLDNLKLSIQCMINKDISNANKIIKEDYIIDNMEKDIESFTIRILALRKPVAQDLRRVVACLKISADIERLGDYAVSIAKRIIAIKNVQKLPAKNLILAMLQRIEEMFINSLHAFLESNSVQALHIWKQDEDVDDMYIDILRNLLTYMIEDVRNIGHCTQLLFIAKHLERAGDHVKNICEMTYYMVHGQAFQLESNET